MRVGHIVMAVSARTFAPGVPGGVKCCATNALRSNPVVPRTARYDVSTSFGASRGRASTNVFESGKTRASCTSWNSGPNACGGSYSAVGVGAGAPRRQAASVTSATDDRTRSERMDMGVGIEVTVSDAVDRHSASRDRATGRGRGAAALFTVQMLGLAVLTAPYTTPRTSL